MAEYTVGLNDPPTVKRWSADLNRSALARVNMMPLVGKGPTACIQLLDDLSKGPGDTIHTFLRMQGSGSGVAGDNNLEGHEEDMTVYSMDFYINQLRHAFKSGGRMVEQRVPYNVQREMKDLAADWAADRLDTIIINHLCGYSAQTDNRYTGFNTINAPDSTHQIWSSVSGTITNDESLTSTDIFDVNLIDKAVNLAQVMDPIIRPIKYKNNDYYICLIHPDQMRDLRDEDSQWYDAMKSALQGGEAQNNPLFTGAAGVWNNVIFRVNRRVTQGVHHTTGAAVSDTRRAVLLGAQAAVVGFGRMNGPNRFTWVEDTWDFKNKYAVAVGFIGGCAATRYNSMDYGKIVISTYAESLV